MASVHSPLRWTIALAPLAIGAWLIFGLFGTTKESRVSESNAHSLASDNPIAARAAGTGGAKKAHPGTYREVSIENTTTRWDHPGIRGDAGAGDARLSISGRTSDGDGFPLAGGVVEARGGYWPRWWNTKASG